MRRIVRTRFYNAQVRQIIENTHLYDDWQHQHQRLYVVFLFLRILWGVLRVMFARLFILRVAEWGNLECGNLTEEPPFITSRTLSISFLVELNSSVPIILFKSFCIFVSITSLISDNFLLLSFNISATSVGFSSLKLLYLSLVNNDFETEYMYVLSLGL